MSVLRPTKRVGEFVVSGLIIVGFVADLVGATAIQSRGATDRDVLAGQELPDGFEVVSAQNDALARTRSFGTSVDPKSESLDRPVPDSLRMSEPEPVQVLDPSLPPPVEFVRQDGLDPAPVSAPAQINKGGASPAPPIAEDLSANEDQAEGFVEGESVVVDGSPTSLTFENPDGSQSTKVFSSPAVFEDPATGEWTEFDGTLVREPDNRLHAQDSGNPTSFGAKGNDPALVRLDSTDDESITFRMVGAAAAPGEVFGSTVIYRNIVPGVDLYESSFAGGVKEEIKVNVLPTAAPTYRFEMKLSVGLLADLTDEGGIEVRNGAGEVVFIVPPGVAWESNPASPPVPVTIRLTKENAKTFVELVPDWQWMSAPERTFPLTIDPQVFMGAGSAYPNVYDLYIVNTVPHAWYDTAMNRFGWSHPTSTTTNFYQTNIKFGDIAVPPGVNVTAATFQAAIAQTTFFYPSGAITQGGSTSAWMYRNTVPFENGSPPGPTWANRPKTIDQATRKTVAVAPGALTVDVKNWAESWIEQNEPNHGLTLVADGPAVWIGQGPSPSGLVEMTSFESGLPPWLLVTWVAPPRSPSAASPVVAASQANAVTLRWVDEDAATSSFEICTGTWNAPICVPATGHTWSGVNVQATVNMVPLINTSNSLSIDWWVREDVGGGWLLGEPSWTANQTLTMAPVTVTGPATGHPNPLQSMTISWLDSDRASGLVFRYQTWVCSDPGGSICETSPSGITSGTTSPSTQASGAYPANTPLYIKVAKFNGSSGNSSVVGVSATPFQISNTQPAAAQIQGLGVDGYVTTNRPTLTAQLVKTNGQPVDVDGDPVRYKFIVCDAPALKGNCTSSPVGSVQSPNGLTFTTNEVSYVLPRNWSTTYYWSVTTSDDFALGVVLLNNSGDSAYAAPTNVSPTDGSLGGLWAAGKYPNGAASGSVEASNGNVFFTETDVDQATVGIDIGVTRSYNSLDFRSNNAFGRGWTYPLDMTVSFDNVSDLNATVLMHDGRREFHGRNPDLSYAKAFGYDNVFSYDSTTDEFWLVDTAQTKFRFKRTGASLSAPLVGITDVDGNSILVTRTGMTQVVTDTASGRTLTIQWASPSVLGGAHEHVTSVTTSGSAGATWTYSYSGDLLRSSCSPDVDPGPAVKSLCTQYEHDTAGRITRLWSPQTRTGPAWAPNLVNLEKVRLDFTYDSQGRVMTQVNGVGSTWTYAYSPNSPIPNMTDAGTVTARFQTVVTDPLGHVKTLGFDAHRRLQYEKSESGVEDWFTYNDSGYLLKSSRRIAAGTASSSFATTEYSVDDFGRNTRRVDPNGATWQWTYNNSSQILSSINPYGQIKSYTYDADSRGNANQGRHNLTKSESPLNLPTPNRLWSLADPSGLTAVDAYGGPSGTYSATGVAYGKAGAPKLVFDNAAGFSGGAVQIPTAALQGADKTFALWFQTTEGGVLLSKNGGAAGSSTVSGWNPVLYVDDNGRLRAEVYGSVQPITATKPVNDGAWHYAMLSVSTTTQTLYLDGVKIDSQAKTVNDTTWGYSHAYIGTGFTSSWPTMQTGWQPFEGTIDDVAIYDRALTDADLYVSATIEYTNATTPAFGNPSARPPLWLISKTTDQAGRVTSFEYDQGGDLRRMTDPAGVITEYTYDSVGRRLTERSSVDGVNWIDDVTNTYDAAGRLIHVDGPPVVNAVTGNVHRRRTTNVYDDAGLLLSITESDIGGSASPDAARTTTYHYDDAGRRDRVTNALGAFADTEYDAAGRIIKTTDERGTVVRFTRDQSGRETSVELVGFAADPIGAPNTIRNITTSRTKYDIAGRVSETTDALGRVQVITYDVMGWPTRVDLYQSAADRAAGTIWKVLSTTSYDLLGQPTQVATAGRVVAGVPVMTNVVNNSYDRFGRLASSTTVNAASNGGGGAFAGGTSDVTTTYTYDNLGNVTTSRQTGALGVFTESRTTYDVHLQPQIATVENGATDITSTVARDARGRMVSTTDALGAAITFDYDVEDRPVRQTMPTVQSSTVDRTSGLVSSASVSPTITTGYNTFGEQTHYRDENGNVTHTQRDVLGRPSVVTYPSYTNPDSPVATVTPTESFAYDAVGNLISRTDRRGSVTTFDFDRRNRVVRQTDPLATGAVAAGVWRVVYDDAGNVTRTTNPEGAVVETSYDALNRVTSQTEYVRWVNGVTTPTPLVTTYTLDDAGRATTVCSPAPSGQQRCINNVFAPQGQVLSTQDANLKVTRFAYDGLNRKVAVIDPMGRRSTTTWDTAGRPVGESYYGADGSVLSSTTLTLDPLGRAMQVNESDGGRLNYAYDAAGRLTSTTELISLTPLKSITTSYGYDPAGNQTLVRDGRNKVWGYTYNSWNLLQDQIEPSVVGQTGIATRRWTNNYDAGGLVVSERHPGPVTVNHGYDQLGRRTSSSSVATTNAPAAAASFTYDLLGRLKSASHPSGTVSMVYNERNQLTAVGAPNSGNSSMQYDEAGRLTQRVDGAGTTTYEWDPGDRLFRETDPLTGQRRTFSWNDAGQVTNVSFADTGGASRQYSYDTYGRLSQDTIRGSNNTALRTVAYGYDPVTTRLVTETVTGSGVAGAGTNTYGYDLAGRLTSWAGPSGTTVAYQWDDNGNRIGMGTMTASYDDRNRLISTSNGETYTWSPRGTLRTKVVGTTTTNYTFDGLDRMTVSGTVTFTYDGLNRAASRKVGTTTSQIVYSGLGDQPTKDGSNTIARSPMGDPIAVRVGVGMANTVLQDRHGDVVSLMAPSGTALANTVDYTPFGEIATGTNPTRVGFQGDWTDPTTGFVNMGARWYSPTAGRFISRDTVKGALESPVSLNRYTYAHDDPIGLYDPDGHRAVMLDRGGRSNRPTDAVERMARSRQQAAIRARRAQAKQRRLETFRRSERTAMTPKERELRDLDLLFQGLLHYNRNNKYYDITKDPAAQQLAHMTVMMNMDTFDSASKGNAPDGNISENDFETVRDNDTFHPALQMASRILLANNEDVNHGDAQKDISADAKNVSKYGWKLYKTQQDDEGGVFGWVKDNFLTILSFVPVVGDVIDFFGCVGGDLISCAAMIPGIGTLANGAKTMDNFTDLARSADNFADAGKAASNSNVVDDLAAEVCGFKSFSAETEVLLADGSTKPISEIEVGDEVVAFDPETGQRGARAVTHVWVHDDTLVELEVGSDRVPTTEDHPFWNETDQAWQDAQVLDVGDRVLSADGDAVVVGGLDWSSSTFGAAYNLTVDEIHTYYVRVGAEDILVHNTNCAAGATNTADDIVRLGTKDSWGSLNTLDDHFARHGADFAASSADDYARQASEFLQQPGTLTKIDPKTGVIRVYDPASNTFGAYNATGTTRTFYKPDPALHGYSTNLDYWNAQPG